jgi:hypothetical protein
MLWGLDLMLRIDSAYEHVEVIDGRWDLRNLHFQIGASVDTEIFRMTAPRNQVLLPSTRSK